MLSSSVITTEFSLAGICVFKRWIRKESDRDEIRHCTLPICTFADQENSTLLEWPEPVSPLVPVWQRISWIYVDCPNPARVLVEKITGTSPLN